jgi:hypothetical protein
VKNGCAFHAEVNANWFLFTFVLHYFSISFRQRDSSYFANLPFVMKEKYKMAIRKWPPIYIVYLCF